MPRYLVILLIPAMVLAIGYLSHTPADNKLIRYSAEQTMPVASIGDLFSR